MMKPVRAAASGFPRTENDTVPLPAPSDGGVIVTQLESLAALHEHSRSVLTATVPLPPLDGKDVVGPDRATPHLPVLGASVFVVDDDPHPSSAEVNGSRTTRRTTGGSSLALMGSCAFTPPAPDLSIGAAHPQGANGIPAIARSSRVPGTWAAR
jgi:hypothetical protein